jgi:trans-aconitate 3-methyltransferase
LGTDGFSYRTAGVEESKDIPNGSVDMVFATNVMHFCNQERAMKAIANQLKSGGTFACAAFGAAHFEDARIHDIYERIGQAGARVLLNKVNDPHRLISAIVRTQGSYNVAPLNEVLFLPGAQRIHLNMPAQGITSPLPPEIKVVERPCTGFQDVQIIEKEEGWSFVTDLDGVREQIASFPFGRDVPTDLWHEMEEAAQGQVIKGHWPAKIILATRL